MLGIEKREHPIATSPNTNSFYSKIILSSSSKSKFYSGGRELEKLDSQTNTMLWVPQGFAHGFVVLSEQAIFSYKCDNYYSPEHDAGILWNDPELAIDWMLPEDDIRVSEKDSRQPFIKDAYHFSYDDFKQENVYPRS